MLVLLMNRFERGICFSRRRVFEACAVAARTSGDTVAFGLITTIGSTLCYLHRLTSNHSFHVLILMTVTAYYCCTFRMLQLLVLLIITKMEHVILPTVCGI